MTADETPKRIYRIYGPGASCCDYHANTAARTKTTSAASGTATTTWTTHPTASTPQHLPCRTRSERQS